MDDSLTFSFHFATSSNAHKFVCLELSFNKFDFSLNKFHFGTCNAHKFVCWELSLNKFDQSVDRPRLSEWIKYLEGGI